jgi:hypothetical protein
VIDAARTPEWSIGLDRRGQIMATRDSGQIGQPWVVRAERVGRGIRVSMFSPGDDVEAQGDVVGDLVGNPREIGRQFRDLLSGLNSASA